MEAVGSCKVTCTGPVSAVYGRTEEQVNKGDSTIGLGKRIRG